MQPAPDQRLPRMLALLRQGQVAEASRLCAQVLAEQPDQAQARFVSALIDRQSGRADRAVATLESLHAAHPANPAFLAELAATRVMAGRADAAIPTLREIAAAEPNQPFTHYWLGQALLRTFQGAEAARCFERVREISPLDRNILHPLAAAYLSIGRPRAAEELLRELLASTPDNPEALATLGATLEQQNRLPEAGATFRRLLEIAPGNGRALAGLARVLQTEGRRDEARRLLEPALRSGDAAPVVISSYAGLCSIPEERLACIAAARGLIDDPGVSDQDRAGLCFAAARLLDADGDPDGAFALFARGNGLYPRAYDPGAKRAETDQIIRTFSAGAIRSMPRARSDAERPIFVLGFPRSGTTLVEQILAAHPAVHAGGELQDMRQIWRDLVQRVGGGAIAALSRLTQADVDAASLRYLDHLCSLSPDAERVTDKMPHNFEQLGLINLLFPRARVIHCLRSPLDTCVSCYTIQFGLAHAYATDLAHLGHAYAEYRRLMSHWRGALDIPMLDVVYEDLVADLEPHARRIVEFAGLPWDDACLRYYEAARAVTSASLDQVRRPIYTSSVARWKRYEKHLGPLIEALRAGGVTAE